MLECKTSPSSSGVLIVSSESWEEGSLFGAGISVNKDNNNHSVTIDQKNNSAKTTFLTIVEEFINDFGA